MIARRPLAYKGEEACKLLSMMVHDARGSIAAKSDSQRVTELFNKYESRYLRGWPPLIFTVPDFVDPLIELSKFGRWVDKMITDLIRATDLPRENAEHGEAVAPP